MQLQDLISSVGNPGIEFRGAPFWAWNSKLEPDELREQIRLFQEMGMGGFFMHSRVGLNTAYLSDEWFDCIQACIDEAAQQGIKAWLYDEDRWPSGAAGGIVTKAHPEFRRRGIMLSVLENPDYSKEDDLAWFAGKVSNIPPREDTYSSTFADPTAQAAPRGIDIAGYHRLKKYETIAEGESFIRFFEVVDKNNSWYNDGAYLDTCNEKAVQTFIETTHDQYAKRYSRYFGNVVPGIFSDEPNCAMDEPGKLTWTERLVPLIQERYGYNLLDFLPELFFNCNGSSVSPVRLHYYNAITYLFDTAFSRQIGEWCKKHNLQMTGHIFEEDTISKQQIATGAAMRFYEYMQLPGMDHLTEHHLLIDCTKQLTSVAHQMGQKERISEVYGCTGWDFPFMGHKALGDLQAAMGVNRRCQHLAWYSMEGEAKRDYPASISYQSPWYKYYSVVEDYFAREGAALAIGEEQRDVLVIHPIETAWFGKSPLLRTNREKAAVDDLIIKTHLAIIPANIDFDYGDESMIARWGRVENGAFVINKASYKVVVLPQLVTIRRSTLELLEQFVGTGGSVFYLGEAPAYVDGIVCGDAARIYKGSFRQSSHDKLASDLTPAGRRISITAAGRELPSFLHIIHADDEIETLFINNVSVDMTASSEETVPSVRERSLEYPVVEVSWKHKAGKYIYELDLATGKLFNVNCSTGRDGMTLIHTSFSRLQSRLFVASDDKVPAEDAVATPFKAGIPLNLSVDSILMDEPNVLVLDQPAYSIDGGPYMLPAQILKVDDLLRQVLGKEPRGGAMCQPWCTKPHKPERRLDVKLKFTFELQYIPTDLRVAIENPAYYKVAVNGSELDMADCGWWCDHGTRMIKIPAEVLQKGMNTLILHCPEYHEQLAGLEAIFLLGTFGVFENIYHSDVIREQPAALAFGDWTVQGLRYYSGNLVYNCSFERPQGKKVILKLDNWDGTALAVSVNGAQETFLPWPPFVLDISSSLRDGSNTLQIKVLGHRRNSHGPFYSMELRPSWVGPWEMKEFLTTYRKVVPCGILEAPSFVIEN